jgi:hypothetical protein
MLFYEIVEASALAKRACFGNDLSAISRNSGQPGASVSRRDDVDLGQGGLQIFRRITINDHRIDINTRARIAATFHVRLKPQQPLIRLVRKTVFREA